MCGSMYTFTQQTHFFHDDDKCKKFCRVDHVSSLAIFVRQMLMSDLFAAANLLLLEGMGEPRGIYALSRLQFCLICSCERHNNNASLAVAT